MMRFGAVETWIWIRKVKALRVGDVFQGITTLIANEARDSPFAFCITHGKLPLGHP